MGRIHLQRIAIPYRALHTRQYTLELGCEIQAFSTFIYGNMELFIDNKGPYVRLHLVSTIRETGRSAQVRAATPGESLARRY